MQPPDGGPSDPLALSVDGRSVADYVWRPQIPGELAPRPYLHPVRTSSGTAVTELMPPDHRHHLGAGVAIPSINGVNFWGGRSYVRDHGPMLLDNHGSQHHVRWLQQAPDGLRQELAWVARSGTVLISEHRTIAVRPYADDCWILTFGFTLTNVTQGPLTVRSPAVSGRDGAGYGGLFWRGVAAAGEVRAFSADADTGERMHGCAAPWVAFTGGQNGTDRPWTLVFAGADARTRKDPWFIRADDYFGVGSALAWDRPLAVEPGEAISRRFNVAVADGVLTRKQAAASAAHLDEGPPGPFDRPVRGPS